MSKIISVLSSKVYIITSILAISALVISQMFMYSKINTDQNKVLSFEESTVSDMNNSSESSVTEATLEENLGNVDNIPHLFCSAQAYYSTLPESDTYNENFAYPTYFMGSGSHFQDVNGDNLVDYIWNNVNLGGSTPELEATNQSCVYLNNGNGWTRASVCSAKTRVNQNTGQVITAEYRGDCADTSSVKQEN